MKKETMLTGEMKEKIKAIEEYTSSINQFLKELKEMAAKEIEKHELKSEDSSKTEEEFFDDAVMASANLDEDDKVTLFIREMEKNLWFAKTTTQQETYIKIIANMLSSRPDDKLLKKSMNLWSTLHINPIWINGVQKYFSFEMIPLPQIFDYKYHYGQKYKLYGINIGYKNKDLYNWTDKVLFDMTRPRKQRLMEVFIQLANLVNVFNTDLDKDNIKFIINDNGEMEMQYYLKSFLSETIDDEIFHAVQFQSLTRDLFNDYLLHQEPFQSESEVILEAMKAVYVVFHFNNAGQKVEYNTLYLAVTAYDLFQEMIKMYRFRYYADPVPEDKVSIKDKKDRYVEDMLKNDGIMLVEFKTRISAFSIQTDPQNYGFATLRLSDYEKFFNFNNSDKEELQNGNEQSAQQDYHAGGGFDD